MKIKTLLITLPHLSVYRNLFFFPGSTFEHLKAASENGARFRMVVVVPPKDAGKYEKVLGPGLGMIYTIEPVGVPRPKRLFERVFYFAYSYLIYTGTTRLLATIAMRPDEPPAGGKRWLAPVKWTIANTLGRMRAVRLRFVPWLFYRVYRARPFKELFDRYQPDIVCISHLYGWADQHLLAEAKRRRIATMGMASGWDHLDKYYLPFHVDRLLAQSEEMQEAAIQHQLYPEKDIEIVGYSYFDFIQEPKNLMTRKETLERLGFPEDARFILYVSGSAYCPDEPDIIEEMVRWIDAGEFENANLHLVVRPYPGARGADRAFDEEKFNRFESHPRVGFYRQPFWGDIEKSRYFISLLAYAEVVLAVYTTIALEAVVLDTPILAPAFDGHTTRPLHRSIRRFEMMDHFQHVLRLGAMATARNFGELRDYIVKYLADRSYLAKNRAEMRRLLCGPLDSKASRRTAEAIIRAVEDVHER